MARLTRQAKATKQLLSLLIIKIEQKGLSSVSTEELVSSCVNLSIKSNDKDIVLLEQLLEELQERDFSETDCGLMLKNAVSLINKGGQEVPDNQLTKKELLATSKKTQVEIKRC